SSMSREALVPSRCEKEKHTVRRMGSQDFPSSHLCWGHRLEPPRTAQSVVFPSSSTECRWHSCSLIIPASLFSRDSLRCRSAGSALAASLAGGSPDLRGAPQRSPRWFCSPPSLLSTRPFPLFALS
ncbi:unnamed protein product, partial [Coccothraustes coccothraustes]